MSYSEPQQNNFVPYSIISRTIKIKIHIDAGLQDLAPFCLNGNDIRLTHVPNAHTDGDAIVQFTEANVIHTGDTFFNGFYPFIDTESEGSIAGMIAACDVVLALADDKTRIMPGHGPLANRADLLKFKEMLIIAERNIAALVEAGKSVEEVIAAKPTAELDAEWADGFLSADVWVKIVYTGMKK